MTNLRTCSACGWVHFGMTREDAQAGVDRFNEYYDRQPETVQDSFSGRSTIGNYERCFRCGGSYKLMRPAKEGDCPHGCTIQSIIMETT